MSNVLRLAAVSVFATLTFGTHAAVITSVNRATFQAAAANQQISQQNFDSLAVGTVLSTLNGVTYGSSAGQPLVTNTYLTSTGANGLGHTGLGYFGNVESATFTFANAITAFAIDINTAANQVGDFTVVLNTGDTVRSLNEVFPNQTSGQFIGFVSNAAFTSVTLSSNAGSTSPNRTFTLDTLVYGMAASVVPEPGTMALMLMGLALVSSAHQVRRTRAEERCAG